MTIFICDGDNILMDKVTTLEYKSGEYNLKDPVDGPLSGHYENRSKFCFLDPAESAKVWGVGIKFYSGIGTIDYTWDSILREKDLELSHIFLANQHWKFLSNDMRVIILDENDTLSQLYFDRIQQRYRATEITQADYTAKKKLTIEGYFSDAVDTFQFTNNVKLTAIEAMVFAQSLTPNLGRRFDHFHIPSGTVTYDIDLSDRERSMVIDRIEKRIQLSRKFDSVYLLNTPDGK